MSMSDERITEQMEKNLDSIRELIGKLNRKVSDYNKIAVSGKSNYGHVGDLGRLQHFLKEALRIEDRDPS